MEGNEITIIDQVAGFIQSGGVFMGVILAVWGIGVAIALERFRRLSKGFDVPQPGKIPK